MPRPRLGRARATTRTPATATSRRCTSVAGLADGEIPYIGQEPDKQVEYPVLTGAVMWATAQLVPSDGTPNDRSKRYFDINALALALAAGVVAVATALAVRPSAWDAAMFAARAGPRAVRHDQLGPVRRGVPRTRHVGLGTRPSGRPRGS